ncbi:M23 family metallopeptidase [Dermatobacter hominis]|uniref:M23 family metallopeptidase n=1 Tax=Dermatobacter hominis TaxID=2884263 RepID=UPI0027154E31|nr:M23 family metallopeptidase [Dermatobacter hominis]
MHRQPSAIDPARPRRHHPAPRWSHAVGLLAVTAALAALAACAAPPASVAGERAIVFPVAARVTYSDTFGAARSGGRSHEGQDLMAAKHTPVVAAVDGTVTSLNWSNSGLSGNSLTITDADGWRYVYIHLNNDWPGTDDGSNVYERAFADGIAKGQKVKAGEIVGFVGDSGNAESTGAHLHFEIRRPDGSVINAYSSLRASKAYVRTEALRIADAPTGALDAVARGGGSVDVSGWALDAHANTPVKVSVYVGGNPVRTVTANGDRPDIGAAFGRGSAHGFVAAAVVAPPGAQVCAIAHSLGGGGSTRLGCGIAG